MYTDTLETDKKFAYTYVHRYYGGFHYSEVILHMYESMKTVSYLERFLLFEELTVMKAT